MRLSLSVMLWSMVVMSFPCPKVAHAQAGSSTVPPLRVGVQGGLARTTVSGENVVGMSNRDSYAVGLTLTIPVIPVVEVRPELDYISKGANTTGNAGSLKLNYVQIPLLARINLITLQSVTPYLIAGPAVARKTGCTIDVTNSGATVSTSCAAAGLNMQSVDFGVIAGGGLSFTQRSYRATLGARYDYGLMNIVRDATATPATNRAWLFLVGVDLPVSK